MQKTIVRFVVNNQSVEVSALPSARLLDVVREELDLTGTKEGCGQGECGACTVLLDGKAVNACLVLVGQVEGRNIETIEGLATGSSLHPLQQAFIDEGAVQCGYCTPGMLLSAKALLSDNPTPSEAEIRVAIAGNLCRCTGYTKIIKAIQSAAWRARA